MVKPDSTERRAEKVVTSTAEQNVCFNNLYKSVLQTEARRIFLHAVTKFSNPLKFTY